MKSPKLISEYMMGADSVILCKVSSITASRKEHLCAFVIDTKNKDIRELLIELGWTPPKENNG